MTRTGAWAWLDEIAPDPQMLTTEEIAEALSRVEAHLGARPQRVFGAPLEVRWQVGSEVLTAVVNHIGVDIHPGAAVDLSSLPVPVAETPAAGGQPAGPRGPTIRPPGRLSHPMGPGRPRSARRPSPRGLGRTRPSGPTTPPGGPGRRGRSGAEGQGWNRVGIRRPPR